MISLLLTLVLASDGGIDGGSDAPLAETGVHKVVSAVQTDGGVLGPGWHLTPSKMQKVGEHIIAADNAKAQAEHERDEAVLKAGDTSGARWFVYGTATGVVAGAMLLILGLNAVAK